MVPWRADRLALSLAANCTAPYTPPRDEASAAAAAAAGLGLGLGLAPFAFPLPFFAIRTQSTARAVPHTG